MRSLPWISFASFTFSGFAFPKSHCHCSVIPRHDHDRSLKKPKGNFHIFGHYVGPHVILRLIFWIKRLHTITSFCVSNTRSGPELRQFRNPNHKPEVADSRKSESWGDPNEIKTYINMNIYQHCKQHTHVLSVANNLSFVRKSHTFTRHLFPTPSHSFPTPVVNGWKRHDWSTCTSWLMARFTTWPLSYIGIGLNKSKFDMNLTTFLLSPPQGTRAYPSYSKEPKRCVMTTPHAHIPFHHPFIHSHPHCPFPHDTTPSNNRVMNLELFSLHSTSSVRALVRYMPADARRPPQPLS